MVTTQIGRFVILNSLGDSTAHLIVRLVVSELIASSFVNHGPADCKSNRDDRQQRRHLDLALARQFRRYRVEVI